MIKMIDIHSHVLPFVDDGANGYEESLSMLKQFINIGVTDVFLTPHVESASTKANRSKQIEYFNKLQKRVLEEDLNINIYLGAEVRYRFNTKLDYKEYTLGNSNYILIEFSSRETEAEEIVYNLKRKGFIPIIAHAERYPFEYKHYHQLKNSGALIQVNASSVLGRKGRKTKKLIYKLFEDKLVDFVASDAHGSIFRRSLMDRAYKVLSKHIDKKYLEAVFYSNAKKIIHGEEW